MARRKNKSYRAIHRNVRMSPRKVRGVVDLIRGKDVEEARRTLQLTKKRAAYFLDRILRSAINNADQSGEVDPDRLYVAEAAVNQARVLKRIRPSAMGRAKPEKKRSCHIQVVLRERPET